MAKMDQSSESYVSRPLSTGTNLTHLLPTGKPTPESLPYGTAANTCSWLLDLKVKVTTVHGKEFTGEIFTYDPVINCLVIKTEIGSAETKGKSGQEPSKRYSFQILKINAIQTISPLSGEDLVSNQAKVQNVPIDHVMLSSAPSPRHLNLDAFILREQKNLSERQDKLRRTNPRAPEGGQEIFDALSKMFPCVWDKDDIVVLDEVRIKPNYKVENCESILPAYVQTLDRVKKTLEAERKKLNFERGLPPTPTKGDDLSKSGSSDTAKEGSSLDEKAAESFKKEKKDSG